MSIFGKIDQFVKDTTTKYESTGLHTSATELRQLRKDSAKLIGEIKSDTIGNHNNNIPSKAADKLSEFFYGSNDKKKK